MTGLDARQTYYFALKVADETANASALSNVVSAVSLPREYPGNGKSGATRHATELDGVSARFGTDLSLILRGSVT